MFNPFVNDLSELTDAELQNKISDVSKKYWQTSNEALRQQIAVVLQMMQDEQQRRAFSQKKDLDDPDLDSLININ